VNARLGRLRGNLARGAALARDLCLTAIVVPFVVPLWLLPWSAARAVARVYGLAAFAVWGEARRAAMMNLRRAYGPSQGLVEARRATRAVFQNMAVGIADGVQFSRRFRQGRHGWEDLCQVEDPELEARLLADPRPKVFVTAHLGSWEVTTAIAGRRIPGAVIGRSVDNPFLDRLVRWVRQQNPGGWIEKRGAAARALSQLRHGNSVAILLDENGGPDGVFVDFFGRPASTARTAALLSLMSASPVVVGAALRREPGARFFYRLAWIDPPAGLNPAASVRVLTAQIVAVCEQWVRDDPQQWRWLHWRWRTRPDGTEERYRRRDLMACFRQPAHVASDADTLGRPAHG
jgi:Kdo2-lipid IVA lauroyltransferase/acyltransferase